MTKPKVTITVDKSVGMYFMKEFNIKPVCYFCKNPITEDNFGGMFDKDKVLCNSLPCIIALKDMIEK